MNPWLMERLAEARADDWRRAVGTNGVAKTHPSEASRPTFAALRPRMGALLIRAGSRLGRVEVITSGPARRAAGPI